MKLQDKFNIVGHPTITKVYADGRKEVVLDEENLIVSAAKLFILSSICSPGIISDPIKLLKVGTGGCIDTQGLYPKTENPTQADLVTPIASVNTTYYLDSDAVSVTFLADIDQTSCNGQMITEAGLFKVGGKMFNIKNHPGIAKTSEFSLHYNWVIKFL